MEDDGSNKDSNRGDINHFTLNTSGHLDYLQEEKKP